MIYAAVFLAGVVLLGGSGSRARARSTLPVRARALPHRVRSSDPMAFASTLDVLAACLRSGMPVSTATSAAAQSAPPRLAAVLLRAADLLALGADPATAWANPVNGGRHTDALLRLARRSASSGTALAQGVAELAARSRDDAADAARSAAERASVLIAGPLGVCYLPAFICLGIVPVVAGLAGDVLGSGIL